MLARTGPDVLSKTFCTALRVTARKRGSAASAFNMFASAVDALLPVSDPDQLSQDGGFDRFTDSGDAGLIQGEIPETY